MTIWYKQFIDSFQIPNTKIGIFGTQIYHLAPLVGSRIEKISILIQQHLEGTARQVLLKLLVTWAERHILKKQSHPKVEKMPMLNDELFGWEGSGSSSVKLEMKWMAERRSTFAEMDTWDFNRFFNVSKEQKLHV
jgi:hypothetical protein